MKDRELINYILGELNLETKNDLIEWVTNFGEGYECDHYYGFTYDEESGCYHVTTQEEKEEQRRQAIEYRRRMQKRWDEGDRSLDMLMWRSIQQSTEALLDNIFSAKPLLWHNLEKEGGER